MKDLSNNQFDELLKQKNESFNYDFDENAWAKMEQKLRKKDRIIFFRNASFSILLLLFFGGAYFILNKELSNYPVEYQTKKLKPAGTQKIKLHTEALTISKTDQNIMAVVPHTNFKNTPHPLTETIAQLPPTHSSELSSYQYPETANNLNLSRNIPQITPKEEEFPSADSTSQSLLLIESSPSAYSYSPDSLSNDVDIQSQKKRRLALSIAVLAGPEFSSINSFAGSKGTLHAGFLINVALSSRTTLSTGLKYGLKNYSANGYSYQVQNPERADKVDGIDASCNILEIPVQISYALIKTGNKEVRWNTGLSSYLMLKEKYNFRYNTYSGYNDYQLKKTNANQHYLSVLHVSASYHIRLKSSPLKWGIEPYLKLPLGGVGEGNVRLKSSGISLNLIYDLDKNY